MWRNHTWLWSCVQILQITATLIDQVFINTLIGSYEISFKKERIQTLLFKFNYFVFRACSRKQNHYKLSDVSWKRT